MDTGRSDAGDGLLSQQAVGRAGSFSQLVRRRWVAVIATTILMAGYLMVSFIVVPAVTHSGWQYSEDLWINYQLAHTIQFGNYANVYSQSSLRPTPAILLTLLPVEQLTQHLGLSTGFPFEIPRPTAWPVVAPFIVLLSAPALFAADSVAELIGATWQRRMVVGVFGAIALGSVLWWGHPEDALAVAFLLFAMRAAIRRHWILCAWLLGVGIAFQALIVLAVPVVVLGAGWRRLPSLVLRIVAPAAALLLIPFATDWSDTFRAVVEQPVFPRFVRPTVWMHFAPHLSKELSFGGPSVAEGPIRMISIVIAIWVGVWFMQRERSPRMLVWCVALVLSLRVLVEPGLAPYYAWPPMAVALVSAAMQPSKRLWLTCGMVVGVTWLANYQIHTGWLWWPIATGLIVVLATAFPAERHRDGQAVEGTDSEVDANVLSEA